MRGPATTASDDVTSPPGPATRGTADRAGSPDRLCDSARADHGPDRLAGTRSAWCLVLCVLLAAVPAGAEEAPAVEAPVASPAAGDAIASDMPAANDAGVSAPAPPGPAPSPDTAPSSTRPAAANPTAAVYWTSCGLLSVFELVGAAVVATTFAGILTPGQAGIIGAVALAALLGGGTVVNLVGDHVGGRRGSLWTTPAFVGGAALGGVVTAAGAVLGGFLMIIGSSGGSNELNSFHVIGTAIIGVGGLAGAAVGAVVPAATYLAGKTSTEVE
jgi:hypothetical protein